MKNLSLNLLKLFLVRTITVFLVASDRRFAYAKGVHPHGELALVGYKSQKAHTVRSGLFLCVISLCFCISMVKLERDTFECAGNLLSLSTNPFQLCHPHLVVIGKAPKSKGAH
ncbi:hypothetical protein AMQ28_04290 [Acinetobacter sp. TTH0-4]|nr:hypothetical protein AMQ28_04290 [Acinetobacter sp. TTH0-4]